MKWHRQFWEEPQAQAEFDYWTKVPTWSPEEIVALSLSKDPRFVSSEKFVQSTRGTVFSATYFERLEIVQRHQAAGELDDRTRSTRVIEWAEEYDFPMPNALVERVQQLEQKRMKKRNTQVGTLSASAIEATASVLQALPDHVTEAVNATSEPGDSPGHSFEAPTPPSAPTELEILDPNEQPLHPKQRKTLLILVGAMVLSSYRYKPGSDMGALTHTLETQLIKLGVPLHKDTIRGFVRAGLDMLAENQSKKK
ncbi:hypothetical protein [Rhabdaerophilum sp. SD176]|uniref:hypothetical protein n=1 Tax=Rhabdaerophilum sp. SD176 TaxID=2983548 RepID=UPI0024DF53B8|nr:hypothetical protein [Rhabdaerophilum sp. SD176]